jgi:hypothetical protein
MISICKNDLMKIYSDAETELQKSYIHREPGIRGWRNGLENNQNINPGATATALILNYYTERKDKWIEQEVPYILKYLLDIQLKDNTQKRTGWAVMSLKPKDGGNVASVDVTAIVISTLYRYWIPNKETDNLQKEIGNAIKDGSEWLLTQRNERNVWGIHNADRDRIFVICNVFDALIPLRGKEEFSATVLDFFNNSQNSDGSWGDVPTGGYGRGDIYHTAKVLNFLVKHYAEAARICIQKGIQYVKNFITNAMPDISYIEESIPDCNGGHKFYYHDGYSELLLFMQNTSDQWTQIEFFRVLNKFIVSKKTEEGQKKYYEDNQRRKKQVWLLIPASSQSYHLANQLFPQSVQNICLNDNGNLLGFNQSENLPNQRNIQIPSILIIAFFIGIVSRYIDFSNIIVIANSTVNQIINEIASIFASAAATLIVKRLILLFQKQGENN